MPPELMAVPDTGPMHRHSALEACQMENQHEEMRRASVEESLDTELSTCQRTTRAPSLLSPQIGSPQDRRHTFTGGGYAPSYLPQQQRHSLHCGAYAQDMAPSTPRAQFPLSQAGLPQGQTILSSESFQTPDRRKSSLATFGNSPVDRNELAQTDINELQFGAAMQAPADSGIGFQTAPSMWDEQALAPGDNGPAQAIGVAGRKIHGLAVRRQAVTDGLQQRLFAMEVQCGVLSEDYQKLAGVDGELGKVTRMLGNCFASEREALSGINNEFLEATNALGQ